MTPLLKRDGSFGGTMKDDEVEKGLMVITTELCKEDPDCLVQAHIDARRPGKAGIVSGRAETNDFCEGGGWLVNHNRGGDVAVYMPTEFKPLFMKGRIEMNAHIHGSFISNGCSICGESPSVATASFCLSFVLCTQILVHFCEDHLNDADVVKGMSIVLAEKARQIEIGVTWRDILEKKRARDEKMFGLMAIRAIDYGQCGCPHCGYQHPDVEFVAGTISYKLCEKCGLPYVVFADGVKKMSAMVEMPSGSKTRATLRGHPLRVEPPPYGSPWSRVFSCVSCHQKYPSDREGTTCDKCNAEVRCYAVPYRGKNKDAVQ